MHEKFRKCGGGSMSETQRSVIMLTSMHMQEGSKAWDEGRNLLLAAGAVMEKAIARKDGQRAPTTAPSYWEYRKRA